MTILDHFSPARSEQSVFSQNELAEDVNTGDLRYLLLPFYRGELLVRVTDQNRRMELLTEALLGISDNPIAILLMLNLILLALGMIMDMAALILICTPIFLPIATQFGMDPIQFGIMMMMNLGLGLCTPPVGACLFVGSVVGKIKIEQTVRTIWPFYLALFAALMLVTYVPALSMALPNWLQ